jgi:hypothetical protein
MGKEIGTGSIRTSRFFSPVLDDAPRRAEDLEPEVYTEHEWTFEQLNQRLDCKLNLRNLQSSPGLSPPEASV